MLSAGWKIAVYKKEKGRLLEFALSSFASPWQSQA